MLSIQPVRMVRIERGHKPEWPFIQKGLPSLSDFLVDGDCSGETVAHAVKEILGATVEVVKRSELHPFKVLPKTLGRRAFFCLA